MALDLSTLATHARELYHCSDCNYCVDAVWAERGLEHVCATMTHHSPASSYSGSGFMRAARALLEGVELAPAALAERVFSCTGCGNCEAVCPIGLHPAAVGETLRVALADADELPAPVRAVRQRMREHGNAWGLPAARRSAWADGVAFAPTDLATVHYAPGCAVAFARPAEARATVAVLQAAGERVHFDAAQDRCCGAPLREAGVQADAAFAERALGERALPGRVVTSGQECVASWRAGRESTQVQAFSEWLLSALETGRLQVCLREPLPAPVQVFDSCSERRLAGAPDRTRAVMQMLGVTVANDPLAARHVVCCGAAGPLGVLHADSALRMGAARATAVQDSLLVAGDVRCLSHVASAAGLGGEQTFGLAEFIARFFDVRGETAAVRAGSNA